MTRKKEKKKHSREMRQVRRERSDSKVGLTSPEGSFKETRSMRFIHLYIYIKGTGTFGHRVTNGSRALFP